MMVSTGPSISLLLIAILTGGIGLPLSIPPAAEDPQLAQLAPENCIYYTSWAGTAEANPDSPNRTERLLAEPELQRFIREAEAQLESALTAQGFDQIAAVFAEQAPLWGRLLLMRPTAFFISELELHDEVGDGGNLVIGERSLTIHGAMVVNLGTAKDRFVRSLQAVRDGLDNAREVQIGNLEFTQWAPDRDGIQLTWGFKDQYLIVATDKAVAAGVIERWETPTPQWLTRLRERHTLARRATLTYANLEKITAPVTDRAAPEWVETIGIDELRSFVAVTGLDERGYVSRTLIEFDLEADGLLAKLASQPLSPKQLAHIPADSTIAVAMRIDGGKLLDAIMSAAEEIVPQFPREFAQFEQGAAQELGFRFSDVLRSLGDTWTLHASPGDGGILTGWTLITTVDKPAELAQHNQRLLAFFRNLNQPGAPRARTVKVDDDTEFYTFLVPDDDFLVAPSWYCDEEKFIFSLYPQPIRAALAPQTIETGLSKAPKCAHLFESDTAPSLVVYVDTATFLKVAYPLLQVGARSLLGQMQRQGLEIDVSIMPSLRAITRHLDPSLLSVRRTQQELIVESHRTVPGGSLGAAAPALAALSVPAITSARTAAQRNQSTNNLKQLMLAMHNYHSAQQSFPPAYTTGEGDKRLLSWRVHLLPYLESGEGVYDQFRLNEPWDSPHNRKLIGRMPSVFRAPGSEADPGKTNYLAIGGPKGIFGTPQQGDQGTRMRDITDGTSNTIGLVEASDDLAVIWTKPDLFTPQEDNPIHGLAGMRTGVILVGICDGRVRAISNQVAPSTLWALFTRNGGEVINQGDFLQ